jgi:hypothetical protein
MVQAESQQGRYWPKAATEHFKHFMHTLADHVEIQNHGDWRVSGNRACQRVCIWQPMNLASIPYGMDDGVSVLAAENAR